MENSFAYLTISSNDGQEKYKLSFGINDEGKPDYVDFSFNHKDELLLWDNEYYLDSLYKTLRYVVYNEIIYANGSVFDDLFDYGLYDDRYVLMSMFERAVKLGLWE